MSSVCRFTPVTFYCCVRGPAFRLCRWKWDYLYSLPLPRRRLCLSVILSMCRITAKVISQFHLNLSRRDVHSRLTNRQPMSPPVCNTRRPGSSTNQIGKIRKKKFYSLCLVRCCGTHYHWLSVMYLWHWLSSVHNWRLFCFPEPTGHHRSSSVTVSAVKFVCANKFTYLLTYWLTFGDYPVLDMDSESLFHFPRHCRVVPGASC